MTIERKVGMGIAGQPSGGPTDVADVFSTHLYTGNSTARSINNGIDLDGEGGMVWIKSRSTGTWHKISDTERGANKLLFTNETDGQSTVANTTTGFNSDGFSLGAGGSGNANDVNVNNRTYTAWTFRKKKKFFDVVTYTGNGTSGREIAHSLDTDIGMIVIKRTDSTGSWVVGHRGSGSYWASATLRLNTTSQGVSNGEFNALTASYFKVTNAVDVNANGATYVAYVFADNSSEDAEEQMIKCGSYTTDSAGKAAIDLGWEPQYVMVKRTDGGSNWTIVDTMRGFPVNPNPCQYLAANTSGAEAGTWIWLRQNGFYDNGHAAVNADFIYMAIRAPMMVEPEAATDVFAAVNYTGDGTYNRNITGFTMTPDMLIASKYNNVDDNYLFDRMRGWVQGDLWTNASDAENVSGAGILQNPSVMDSIKITNTGTNYLNSNSTSYNINAWKRAKGFMDVVAYTGNGTAGRTVAHSLGVAPEMIWVKSRGTAEAWHVYHSNMTSDSSPSSLPKDLASYLNLTNRPASGATWDNTAPTDTVFSVTSGGPNNQSAIPHIAYLFATLDGVSKCGGYTGNGASQTIDCGFAAGARYVLIHRTDDPDDDGVSGDWYVWDSVRGIVAGNDPHLSLNTSAAQVTNDDSVDPHNSGFIVNQVSATNINVSSGTYIFYAIA